MTASLMLNAGFTFNKGRLRGIPNLMMHRNNQASPIHPHQIPSRDDAIQMFESQGGHVTFFSPFGSDPLIADKRLATEREETFHQQYPDFRPFFSTVANGDTSLFRSGLLYFIQLSRHFEVELQRSRN